MILTEEHLHLFNTIPSRYLEAAVTELTLNDPFFKLDSFMSFVEDYKKAEGNLIDLVGRTHQPVSMEEFVTSPAFLNLKIVHDLNPAVEGPKQGVYAKVLEAAVEIVEKGYVEALLLGGIGSGKTRLAQLVTLYDIYNLSTYKHPQLVMNMLPGSPLVFMCLNTTDERAKKVTFGKLKPFVTGCDYFNTHFPYDRRQVEMVLFPSNVRIQYAAATSNKMLGEDVVGAIVDELNFMAFVEKSKKTREETGEFDQAQEVYTGLVHRRASRFLHSNIGRLIMVSSKGHAGDFTQLRKEEVLRNPEIKHKVFIWEQPVWEIKPDSRVITPNSSVENGDLFRVQVGDERSTTRVMDAKETAKEGAEVITVPVAYKDIFISNPEKALRDFAGKSARSSNVFYKSPEDVYRMGQSWKQIGMVSPFQQNVVNFDEGMPDITDGYECPWPELPRAIHLDLSETKDRLGMSMGFVLDVVPIKVPMALPSGEIKIIEEMFPFIVYDFTLGVNPPKSGAIETEAIRQWIYFLKDELKIPIQIVTADQYQSTDSRQILARRGFKTDKVSVEGMLTHEAFRSALHQRRIAAQENTLAWKEILSLVPDYKKQKIDHPPTGSKDIADSIVGVYEILSNQRASWKSVEERARGGRPASSRPSTGLRPKSGRFSMPTRRVSYS